MPLRYFQQEAEDSAFFALCEYDSVLINLPTGAGKTKTAADMIGKMQPKRCIFLADQDELCTQPLDAIHEMTGIIPALEKADSYASLTSRVVVGSLQTLSHKARLERFPPGFFDFAFIDEAHRGRLRNRKVADHIAKKRILLSGTPFTIDMRTLVETGDCEHVAYSMPMLDLIQDGFAPPFAVHRMPVEIDLSQVAMSKIRGEGRDYDAASLSTTIEPYYERIIELLPDLVQGRHPIVTLPLIWSSQAFAEMLRRAGFSAMHVDGKSSERRDIIARFARGDFQFLCNANLLNTGIDIPIADTWLNLCPMHSPIRYQQGFGRIMRVLGGVIDDLPGRDQAAERRARIAASAKPDALVIDLLWQHEKLSVYKPENMISRSADEAKGIYEKLKIAQSPADILEIQKLVQKEREAALVRKLEEIAMRESTQKVDPGAYAFLIGSKSLMQYEPVSGWEMMPPSEPQLRKLEQWGFEVEKVKCMGLASRLIDAALHRLKFRLASPSQLRALHALHVKHDPRRLTMAEATRLLNTAKLAA